MNNTAFAIIAVIIALTLAWTLWLVTPYEQYRVYDCSIAEFHPDYPKEVREECRRIRNNTNTTLTT